MSSDLPPLSADLQHLLTPAETECDTCAYAREKSGEHCNSCDDEPFNNFIEAGWHVKKRLEKKIKRLRSLLREALGEGPECDCPPEGHVCGYPAWAVAARKVLEKK